MILRVSSVGCASSEAVRSLFFQCRKWLGLLAPLLFCATVAYGEGTVFEDFEDRPQTRWEFITDTVMGGVSSGQVSFEKQGATAFARMTGNVSTENRGGFIQFRRQIDEVPPDATKGIRLVVRGNNQKYFVHLRTQGTVLPWQYYQAVFEASATWTEVRLPLSDFQPSGRLLRATPTVASLTSIGVVAFGRDHQALVEVREIDFYN